MTEPDIGPLVPLREPCNECGCIEGTITTKGGQDVLYCANCRRYQYCAPRTETGRATRTLRRTAIPPSKRARVFARHHNACVGCGAHPPTVELVIGHLVPRDEAINLGLPEHLADHDLNLAPMCPECNSGIGKNPIAIGLMYRLLLLHLRAEGVSLDTEVAG